MTAPELMPCPFCGGEAHLRDDVSHSTAYFIGCATEDCFGEIHWGKSEAEAVSGWNTRADLIPATPLAAALAVPEVAALVEAARRCRNYAAHSPTTQAEINIASWLTAALRGVEGQP